MVSLQLAGHVRHRTEDHGGVVILDTAAGEWFALNPTAGDLWRSWDSGAGFDQGVTEVASRYPDVPPEAIRSDARQFAEDLFTRGLINITPAGSATVMADPGSRLQAWERGPRLLTVAVAWIFLLVASVLVRSSFRTSYALVRASRSKWCDRLPDPRQAARAVTAVNRAARLYPGRAACLEQSLAAVLLGASRRWRLDWCVGSAPDPYRFHAWVEVAGRVVPRPDEPGAVDDFSAVLVA
jgi:hypothetical protein